MGKSSNVLDFMRQARLNSNVVTSLSMQHTKVVCGYYKSFAVGGCCLACSKGRWNGGEFGQTPDVQ